MYRELGLNLGWKTNKGIPTGMRCDKCHEQPSRLCEKNGVGLKLKLDRAPQTESERLQREIQQDIQVRRSGRLSIRALEGVRRTMGGRSMSTTRCGPMTLKWLAANDTSGVDIPGVVTS